MASCEKSSVGNVESDPQPDEKDVVEILSSKSIELSPDGDEAQVKFSSSGAWTARSVSGFSIEWCDVTPESGEKGEQTIIISADGNDTDKPRSARLVITSGDASAEVEISQHYVEYLTLSHDVANIGAEGGFLEVEVVSNVDVAVEIPDDCTWVILDESASDRRMYKFSIEENKDKDSRSVEIIFCGGRSKLRKGILITQDKIDSDDNGLGSDVSIPGYGNDEWI